MAPTDLHKKFSQMFDNTRGRKQKPGISLSADQEACANERGFPIPPQDRVQDAPSLTSHVVGAFKYGAEYLGFVNKPKPTISNPVAIARLPKPHSLENDRKRQSLIEQVKQAYPETHDKDTRGSWGDKRSSWVSTIKQAYPETRDNDTRGSWGDKRTSWVSTIKQTSGSPGKGDKRRSWGGQGDSFQSFAARQKAELARQVAEDRFEPIRDFSAFHLRRPFGPLNSHPPVAADLEAIGRARAAADIKATEARARESFCI